MTSFAELRNAVEKHLQDLPLNQEPAELYEAVSYILSLGGKRIRPVLTLMACEMFGGSKDDAMEAALGMEIFHNFTLMHDDIMDQASIRRGKATVHNKWNRNRAILSGDLMLVLAYEKVKKVENDRLAPVLDLFNECAIRVCEGQQWDMNFESVCEVSIPDYLNMIRLKTAHLLGGCLKMGSIIANAPAQDAEEVYNFGINLGIGFQLMDDILDTFGDEEKFGKRIGGDILANKKTILLIKALEVANGADKEQLRKWIFSGAAYGPPAEKIETVKRLFTKLGVESYARQTMERYFNAARSNLQRINVAEERKQPLASLSESLMGREV